MADLEDLYAQGVQGLILFPGDSIVLAEPVKNIFNKENIPVVITDIGLRSGKLGHVHHHRQLRGRPSRRPS